MANHFGRVHPEDVSEREIFLEPVFAQSFTGSDKNKRYFQVFPEMAHVSDLDESNIDEVPATDLFNALVNWWKPPPQQQADSISLRDCQPFLWHTRFADHTSKHDPKYLCGLVRRPISRDEDGLNLHRIYDAAASRFKTAQDSINEVHETYRWALLNDGSG